MSKKKAPIELEEIPTKNLKADEYWEWRCSIENVGRKKAELVSADLEGKILSLEAQMKASQVVLHGKTRLENAKKSVENADGEYKALKEKIENRLGISLNDKCIDDVTFEVRDLPK